MDRKTVAAVLDALEEAYPEAKCALDHENVFELLVSTMLSAQTTNRRVNRISPALYAAYPDASALADASPEDVEPYIRSIGLYHNKAKNITAMARALVERFDGNVPGNYDDLVSLPGVGRKTANVVLADGFGVQRIAVDTHVFRVSNRIGLAHAGNVLETEKQLMKNIPEPRWTSTHHALIFHGRQCCHAQRPSCGDCPVASFCERNGMDARE